MPGYLFTSDSVDRQVDHRIYRLIWVAVNFWGGEGWVSACHHCRIVHMWFFCMYGYLHKLCMLFFSLSYADIHMHAHIVKCIYVLMKKIRIASSSANRPQKIRVIIRFPPSLGLPLSEHLGAC